MQSSRSSLCSIDTIQGSEGTEREKVLENPCGQ